MNNDKGAAVINNACRSAMRHLVKVLGGVSSAAKKIGCHAPALSLWISSNGTRAHKGNIPLMHLINLSVAAGNPLVFEILADAINKKNKEPTGLVIGSVMDLYKTINATEDVVNASVADGLITRGEALANIQKLYALKGKVSSMIFLMENFAETAGTSILKGSTNE